MQQPRCTRTWLDLPGEHNVSKRLLRIGFLMGVWVLAQLVFATAQTPPVLPSPLTLADVVRIAGERRDEIEGARARNRAAEARPAIVGALSDPVISPSLDHLAFTMGGADVSATVE